MHKPRNVPLSARGLKYKLKIAFYLMSILPLLVCIYLVSNYILPQFGFKADITASVILSIIIAVIGFMVIKEVFDRVLSVTSDAKLIAAGDLNRKVGAVSGEEDEVGDLGDALNQLTLRIRSNMDELKAYSERTTEINLEIQKRVIVLSSLLHISSVISQGARLEDILKLTVEKSRLLANSEEAFLLFREEGTDTFFIKTADAPNAPQIAHLRISGQHPLLGKLSSVTHPIVIDRKNPVLPELLPQMTRDFNVINLLAVSVYLKGKVMGMLVVGNNREGYVYAKDDLELLDIFAKQIAIAVENDILVHRIEKLEIKDPLTGLYNEMFIRSRLQEEIKRAIIYQRPCAFVLLNVDNFEKYHHSFGLLRSETALKKVASIIRDSVSEIDRVARFGDNEFAIVLPEKNKRKANEIADDVRKRIEFSFSEETDTMLRLTVSGGVSENPLDGVDAQELIAKAKAALNIAKTHGKNRIVTAV